MNTGKQVNAMIGLLFLTLLVLGAYTINEGNRQDEATEEVTERNAGRGAKLYVLNCRGCHGLEGLGPEGDPFGVGPKLNSTAFLILTDHNEFGVEATALGEAKGIQDFLFDTIACGRRDTFMPKWSERFGGPLSDQQISNIVTMITNGRWDLVEEEAHHADEAAGLTEDEIRAVMISDPSTLAITSSNCGQYAGAAAQEFRSRDPFSDAAPVAAATAEATAAATQAPAPSDGPVVVAAMSEWAISSDASADANGVTFRVANDGAIAHEFVVVKSDLGATELPTAGGVADESQVEVVGRIDQYAGGETREATFNLAAGNYLLICNLPGHYQLGMTTTFTAN
ncbi:MAG TPA: c-type cytochrome [Dehalococcoidia bacterium]|nr:c-type cytochrome [Dehalococcoidia bacterium]